MRDRNKKCRYFNGIMSEKCEKDITYPDAKILPCWGDHKCQQYNPLTSEEIMARDEEFERHMNLIRRGLSSCCEAPIDTSQVIVSGEFKNHGPRFCSQCGKLLFMV